MEQQKELRNAPWVSVSQKDVAAHPKGRPGLGIYLASAWLGLLGVLFLGTYAIFPWAALPIWFVVWGVISLNGALLLALGSPVGWLIGIIMGGQQVVTFVAYHSSGNGSRFHGLIVSLLEFNAGNFAILALAVAAAASVLYLWDGDRPNLIYRHRYRRYSDAEAAEDEV